ncbi:hypothetical protein [Mycobacterium cookii]|nr:hypothetical protein [Mycobacterium cookii]MCV7331330.1 hypothetical protein [Mycobacterium cookii]
MSTTPLWVPLVVALIGVIGTAGGTIGGMLIQQRASRQREHAQWLREDEARTFEHRREAYVELYRRLRTLSSRIQELDENQPFPFEDWRDEIFEHFPDIAVYGTDKIVTLADLALDLVLTWARAQSEGKQSGELEWRARKAVHGLLEAIREELGVPKGGTLDLDNLPGLGDYG